MVIMSLVAPWVTTVALDAIRHGFSSRARRVRQEIKMSAESRERKRIEKQEVAGLKREGGKS